MDDDRLRVSSKHSAFTIIPDEQGAVRYSEGELKLGDADDRLDVQLETWQEGTNVIGFTFPEIISIDSFIKRIPTEKPKSAHQI